MEERSLITMEMFFREMETRLQVLCPDAHVFVNSMGTQTSLMLYSADMKKESMPKPPEYLLDPLYENYKRGAAIDELSKGIQASFEQTRYALWDVARFQDFHKVKDQIRYTFNGNAKSKNVLQDAPQEAFLDLTKVYEVYLGKRERFIIRPRDLAMWQVTEEEVRKAAAVNTLRNYPAEFRRWEDLVPPSEREGLKDLPFGLYTLTNQERYLGAACIAYEGMAEKIYEEVGPYWVLPSSIHETILLTGDLERITLRRAEAVLEKANQEQLSPHEYLGNHAYAYNPDTRNIQPVYSDAWLKKHGMDVVSEKRTSKEPESKKRNGR